MQKANAVTYQLAPLLRHPKISQAAKQQMINSTFIPTLCYQSQTWTLSKAQSQKITTCEMRCLRKVTNNTRKDRITNISIRKKVGTKPCLNYIDKQRMKWFGHLIRMHPNSTVYSLLQQNIRKEGKRKTTEKMVRWRSRIL